VSDVVGVVSDIVQIFERTLHLEVTAVWVVQRYTTGLHTPAGHHSSTCVTDEGPQADVVCPDYPSVGMDRPTPPRRDIRILAGHIVAYGLRSY
jgi:hypothetical protein